jgi:hypothetical protein
MEDFCAGTGVAFFLFAIWYVIFGVEIGVNRHRSNQCRALCGTVYDYGPSMCVCKNGKTYKGKFPEFYDRP